MAGVLALAGCDALTADPGGDFALKVLGPSPIAVVGKIEATVPFAVAGCASFGLAVQSGGASHAVPFSRQGDGTYLATIPVEWLHGNDVTCLHDARAPLVSHAQLLATCADANRTAAAGLEVSYGTSSRAYLVGGGLPQATVQLLAASADPFRPYTVAVSALEAAADLDPLVGVPLWIDGWAVLQDPLARLRLAVGASSVFLSSGCDPAWSCLDVAVSSSEVVPGEALWGLDTASFTTWWPVWVPATVLDMAFVPSGALIVLSEVGDHYFPPAASVITKVVPESSGGFRGTATVTVIGYFPGERAYTRFSHTADGQLAFLGAVIPATPGPFQSVLHATDGEAVSTRTDATGTLELGSVGSGFYSIGSAQLAPDASAIVVNGRYLGSPDSTYLALPTANIYYLDDDSGGTAWLTDAVALWSGGSFTWRLPSSIDSGGVEVFDAAPPHARVFGYEVHPMPGGRAVAAQLYGATAIGDKLVLTTNTGVRVLGPDGSVIGGSDPLPCGLEPTALAVPTGATTFAVAAGNYAYVFDLSASGAY